jgi:hypothetical protein
MQYGEIVDGVRRIQVKARDLSIPREACTKKTKVYIEIVPVMKIA